MAHKMQRIKTGGDPRIGLLVQVIKYLHESVLLVIEQEHRVALGQLVLYVLRIAQTGIYDD